MDEVQRMKPYNRVVLRCICLTALAAWQLIACVHRTEAQTEAGHSWQTLDSKAQSSETDDPEAIRSLTDEVFAQFGWADRQEVKDRVAERIKNAEVRYRKYKQNTVTEAAVVHAVNNLADRLGAPNYAKTTLSQVRALRAAMVVSLPNFISPDPTGKSVASSHMTPLEGVFVTLAMLHQKMYNPEYQLDPSEWNNAVFQKTKDVSKAHQSGASSSTQSQRRASLKVMGHSRTRELQDAVARAVAADPALLSQLPEAVLQDLGTF